MSTVEHGIEEGEYKGDLELLDRYVGFSAEIVRLSLLGLAAIGFYLKEFVAQKEPPPGIEENWFFTLLGFSGLLLALAVGCGLLHRYYATDGLASHLKALRLSSDSDPEERAKAPAENSLRTSRYRLSRRWLVSSECAAASGVAILGIAFGVQFGVFGGDYRWQIAVYAAAALTSLGTAVTAASWLKILRRKVTSDTEAPGKQTSTESRDQ